MIYCTTFSGKGRVLLCVSDNDNMKQCFRDEEVRIMYALYIQISINIRFGLETIRTNRKKNICIIIYTWERIIYLLL